MVMHKHICNAYSRYLGLFRKTNSNRMSKDVFTEFTNYETRVYRISNVCCLDSDSSFHCLACFSAVSSSRIMYKYFPIEFMCAVSANLFEFCSKNCQTAFSFATLISLATKICGVCHGVVRVDLFIWIARHFSLNRGKNRHKTDDAIKTWTNSQFQSRWPFEKKMILLFIFHLVRLFDFCSIFFSSCSAWWSVAMACEQSTCHTKNHCFASITLFISESRRFMSFEVYAFYRFCR